MDWIDIVVAVIAAAGGFLGAVVANNRQVAVIATKLDDLKEDVQQLSNRVDQHNHFNDRLTRLEVRMERSGAP